VNYSPIKSRAKKGGRNNVNNDLKSAGIFPFSWLTKSKTLENKKQFLDIADFLDNLFFWNSLYEIQ
jgi:hypothetical protein